MTINVNVNVNGKAITLYRYFEIITRMANVAVINYRRLYDIKIIIVFAHNRSN